MRSWSSAPPRATKRATRKQVIRLAIHNHGPEDKIYLSPLETWEFIQPFDSRIGLCLDVGHSARAGVDPATVIRRCATRLYDLHLRDSIAEVGAVKDVTGEIGAGHLDIRGILAALIEVKYPHVVAIEMRKPSGNPLVSLAESLGYLRGLLAA